MIQRLIAKVLGRTHGGATVAEIEDLVYRNKFSDEIPLYLYDDGLKSYLNSDNTIGWVWECSPLIRSSEKTLTTAEALLRIRLPEHAVLQFILHSDPNIKPVLDAYRAIREGSNDPLIEDAIDNYCAFLTECTSGTPQLSNIPLRNYRLIVTLKMTPNDDTDLNEIVSIVRETLAGTGLSPEFMEPPALLDWIRRLLNDNITEAKGPDGKCISHIYDEEMSLNKQILLSETEIDYINKPFLKIGKRYFRSITPKVFPPFVDPVQTKSLFGALWGDSTSDNDQFRTPYLYVLNIIYSNDRIKLQTKADVLLRQEAVGAFARRLQRTQEECRWASDKLQMNEPFARVSPVLWLIGETMQEAEDAVNRAKRIWETQGYLMQEDRFIPWPMLISSLPMGFRATSNNLNMLERDKIMDSDSIMNILPIQVDFHGCNEPVIILQGRTGQICPLAIFSSLAKNFNGFIAAPPGAGKSVLGNTLVFSHYTAGARIRIIDIGGSYKRQCDIFKGRYLDFDPSFNVCLNPFTNVNDPTEDLSAIAMLILQMVYSGSSNPDISENENTLSLDATQYAWGLKGCDSTMDDVRDFLEHYPDRGTNGKKYTDTIVDQAHQMAFNMAEFTSGGMYARYFIGRANFDIRNDRFVLLELGALKNNPGLFRVITLLVLDAITRDLYFSDRKQRRLILFDEAWQFLTGEEGNMMMKSIIEGGFRKARKHGGGLWVITQSILDRKQFGPIGDVIWNYADYKFLLQSEDYDKALAEGLIEADPHKMKLLKSVRRNGTKFSEVYMQTPYGEGVMRLALDPFSYYLFTSDAREVAEIEDMVKRGATYREAINEMVSRYRNTQNQTLMNPEEMTSIVSRLVGKSAAFREALHEVIRKYRAAA